MFDRNFNLSKRDNTKSSTSNPFVEAGLKISNKILTENGGVGYSTTGKPFIDQFGSVGSYREIRSYDDIANDMRLLCSIDLKTAIKFTIYLRIIGRDVKLPSGNKIGVQKGAGLINESIVRMLYIAINHPFEFKNNLKLFISAGSFKDIFKMMEIDITSNGKDKLMLDWDFFSDFILSNLDNDETSDLLKKYLPSVKSTSKLTTQHKIAYNEIGLFLVNKIFGKVNFTNILRYNKIKSSGKGNLWQQILSKKELDKLKFNQIPGRALSKLVNSNFLEKNNLLEVYETWLFSKDNINYTGYPYELLSQLKTSYKSKNNAISLSRKNTINKQFETLLEIGRSNITHDADNGFIVVLDTSCSMTDEVPGTKVSSYSVGLSMALYFTNLINSKSFKDTYINFNHSAELIKLQGETIVDKYLNEKSEAYGSTNILSVAKLFNEIKQSGVDESDFPSGILCVSDGEFNRTGNITAYDAFIKELSKEFSKKFISKFKVVFWDIPNIGSYNRKRSPFQTMGNKENVFYASGLDGSLISFLLNKGPIEINNGEKINEIKTAEDLFEAAMNQELLKLVIVK